MNTPSSLLSPKDSAQVVCRRVDNAWARAVCGEHGLGTTFATTVPLRRGTRRASDVVRVYCDVSEDWTEPWSDLVAAQIPGVDVKYRSLDDRRVPDALPAALHVTGLDSALELARRTGAAPPRTDVARARRIASSLVTSGAALTPTVLKAACRRSDVDVQVAADVVAWLRANPDIVEYTARQLPLPATPTKWLKKHGAFLRDLLGYDVHDRLRARLAVVHLTYVDPAYLSRGGRQHDAWTTGDTHDLAYQPHTVVVVENRDCRVWFPPVDGTVVVEGGGKAAAADLADLPWLRAADEVVYWGDLDTDGLAILDRFRAALAAPGDDCTPAERVRSILMDAPALARYSHLGITHDERGKPIPPSTKYLKHLTSAERAAYDALATEGPAQVRRIEQERLPADAAVTALATPGTTDPRIPVRGI